MEPSRRIKSFFFPERCPFCKKVIEAGEPACGKCDDRYGDLPPLTRGAMGFRCAAPFVYKGEVKRMIRAIKFQKRVQFIPQVAVYLANTVRRCYKDISFDLIIAVPMYKTDQRIRGFNQSVMLAQELSKLLDVPYQDTIEKIKRTKKQHTLKYKERKTNLTGAYRIIDSSSVKGKNILVIDDIITSGTTLGLCCKTLSRAKTGLICCAAIASVKYNTVDPGK